MTYTWRDHRRAHRETLRWARWQRARPFVLLALVAGAVVACSTAWRFVG